MILIILSISSNFNSSFLNSAKDTKKEVDTSLNDFKLLLFTFLSLSKIKLYMTPMIIFK